METTIFDGLRRALLLAIIAAMTAAVLTVGANPASATVGDILDPPSEECKVPPHLWIVAAEVDPDSLESCGYFEDPDYHENRKEAGIYNPNGPFSLLFG